MKYKYIVLLYLKRKSIWSTTLGIVWKAGIYTVLEQFFNRAMINFQFICLEDEILPGDLNSDGPDAGFNPL